MPLLRITADITGPRLHGATVPLLPSLRRALASDPGPVTLMVHGFKYLPGAGPRCPHLGIFARHPMRPGKRVISWPRHLGLRGQPGEGLGISFGWAARGSVWRAWQSASQAGAQLASLIADLHRLDPKRPIHIVAHSMGARVALAALTQSAPGAVACVILLAAAEYEASAAQALRAGGRLTQVLNVTSRENDLYDFLLERLTPAPKRGARMLGQGVLRLPNLTTLQLDCPKALTALRGAGFPIAAPQARICHWSPYLRPGVFPLYRALLAGRIDAARLCEILPARNAPRWSRLVPLPLTTSAPALNKQAARQIFGQI